MKTPKQILFARHQHAEEELQNLCPFPEGPRPEITLVKWLMALRWHLAGLSAVWLAILMLNSSGHSPAPHSVSSNGSSPIAAIQQNREQILQALNLEDPMAIPSDRKKSVSRRPGYEVV